MKDAAQCGSEPEVVKRDRERDDDADRDHEK
jgi:hypothetical protein